MKKIIYSIFTIIILLITIDYAYPQNNSSGSKTKNDMTAAIETLIQRIEKNEHTNREIINDFNELNEKLQKTISNQILPKMAEKTLAISKANNDVAKNYYETLEAAAYIIKYVLPIGGFVVLIGSFIAFLMFILKLEQIKNITCQWIYKGFRIDERDTKHWALIFHTQGLFYYNEALRLEKEAEKKDYSGQKSMISLAIKCSEDAYDRIKNMLEKPNNRDEDKYFTKICSNLCYYYGTEKIKFHEGLEMAKRSLKKGQKYNNLNWIDNYLYFITQFVFHPELKKKEVDCAKKILQKYKISLIAQDICSKDEIDSFDNTFSNYNYDFADLP